MSHVDVKVQSLASRLGDSRKRKVVFLSHCILNENVRYAGGAFRAACVSEIVSQCVERDIGMVQMPCPEQHAWGGVLKCRLLAVCGDARVGSWFSQHVLVPLFLYYTTLVCRSMARVVAKQIADYIGSGFTVIGVVGVDGSATCGVRKAVRLKKCLPMLAEADADLLSSQRVNNIFRACLAEGMGRFMQELHHEVVARRLHVPFLAHDMLGEMNGLRSGVVLARKLGPGHMSFASDPAE